jgi:hypothetical protein
VTTEMTSGKKPRGTSLPLLIGIVGLGLIGYFVGPSIMTYIFYLQERIYINERWSQKPAKSPTAPAAQTPETAAEPNSGGGGASAGGGGMNPDELFARRDADSNGKLEGDEISERMQSRVDELDKDGDKAISKEEFVAGMANRPSGGGMSVGPSAPKDVSPASAPAAEQPAAPKNAEPDAAEQPK